MASGYIAVNLRRHDDAGIAKITVTDETDVIDLVTNELVDLYHADFDDTNDEYEDFLYQVALPDLTHTYSITVEHSGDHNVSAAGPDYTVEYSDPYRTDKLNTGLSEGTITLWHTSYPSDTYTFDLVNNTVTELSYISKFNGNGSTTEFTLPSTIHASDFLEFSIDSGSTWDFSTDTSIYWGSNAPDYDDETIDSSGNFTVKFLSPPTTGSNNVQIKINLMTNKYKINHVLKQPTDGISYTDHRAEIRFLDYSLELIKDRT